MSEAGARYAEKHHARFHGLLVFLARIPAVRTNDTPWGGFASGMTEGSGWWVNLSLDIHHPLAWHGIQELAFVLNGLSLQERLPTTFKPVSPPPYLNGGPEDYLAWIIECSDDGFAPGKVREWLATRLPEPVDDPGAWTSDPEEDDGS